MLTTKNFFILMAITNFGYGLALLFAPEFMVNLYATQKVDATGVLFVGVFSIHFKHSL